MTRHISITRTVLFATIVCVWGGSIAAAAETMLKHVDVFRSGVDGYDTYRIPAIETTPDGTLIAAAEARKFSGADPGFHDNDIDLVVKRSSDGGDTWSEMVIIDDPGERWSACNPATLVDRTNGRVWLFHCRTKPGRSSVTARAGTRDAQNWARYSDDNGATWSEPVDITAVARDVDAWGGSFFGPGGAIQDRRGRLIVPLARSTGVDVDGTRRGGPWNAFVVYSDDHGASWQRGALIPDGEWSSEEQVVELADGRLMMDSRQMKGDHRWLSTSDDGGETWSVPREGVTVSPVACAIERYTLKSRGDDRDRIVWTGPKGPGRKELVIRTSYDEGETFTNERTISTDLAAYSDLTVMAGGVIGVLWERDDYKAITLSRFDRAFLEP